MKSISLFLLAFVPSFFLAQFSFAQKLPDPEHLLQLRDYGRDAREIANSEARQNPAYWQNARINITANLPDTLYVDGAQQRVPYSIRIDAPSGAFWMSNVNFEFKVRENNRPWSDGFFWREGGNWRTTAEIPRTRVKTGAIRMRPLREQRLELRSLRLPAVFIPPTRESGLYEVSARIFNPVTGALVTAQTFRTIIIFRDPAENPAPKAPVTSAGEAAEPELAYSPAPRMKLFPNPAENKAFISLNVPEDQQMSIDLVDMGGAILRNIRSHGWLAAGDYQYDIDLSGLATGTYLVRVRAGKKVQALPVIKAW
ncbi:MAG: T9SS type A sorting domain-containing protein [Bacteroidota bacterium]